MSTFGRFVIGAAAAPLLIAAAASPPYTTHIFKQRLDHFRSGPSSEILWPQRYLMNDTFWRGPGHPILFYTGNEGPIPAFWGACGFVTDVLAPKLGALVIFAEQRFYGASMPFGEQSLTPEHLVYLSTEQVLADYAHLLATLKPALNASASKVVSFGGSYGGTLSTIFRAKYPHVVVGALAASAPLGYYSPSYWAERGVNAYTWFDTVVRVYSEARPKCYEALVRGVGLANASAISTDPKTRSALATTFGLCAPPAEPPAFVYWITEALESMPQVDYKDAGSPVNATCQAVKAELGDVALLTALAKVVNGYYGLGGGGPCTPEKAARNIQVGGGTPGDGPSPKSSWGYQSCTETLHAFSTPPNAWREYSFSLPEQQSLCQQYYNATPRTLWLEEWSGGYKIADKSSGHSNIIWSNGRRDPWHGGGFLRASDALPGGAVFVMEETAHHQDLRLPQKTDPMELTKVREEEEKIIRGWLGL